MAVRVQMGPSCWPPLTPSEKCWFPAPTHWTPLPAITQSSHNNVSLIFIPIAASLQSGFILTCLYPHGFFSFQFTLLTEHKLHPFLNIITQMALFLKTLQRHLWLACQKFFCKRFSASCAKGTCSPTNTPHFVACPLCPRHHEPGLASAPISAQQTYWSYIVCSAVQQTKSTHSLSRLS